MANKVELEIVAQTKDAIKSLQNLEKQGTSAVQGVSKAFSGLKVLAGAAVAVFAGRALVSGINEVIDAASKQEDAINQLNSALKISGKFSEDASKGIQEFASTLQRSSKFGDELILENAALIQSLGGLEEDGLKKATQAAADMAAALGIDLTSAATLVGKAAAGEVSSFSRYGVVIKKGADNASTFANALDALNSKFGGAAAAQINTYSGATTQLSNTYGDLLEEIGFLITNNEAVISGIKAVEGVFAILIDTIRSNQEQLSVFITSLANMASSVLPLFLNVTSSIIEALNLVATGIAVTTKGFTSLAANVTSFVNSTFGIGGKAANNLKKFSDSIDPGSLYDGIKNVSKGLDKAAEFARDFKLEIKKTTKEISNLKKQVEDTFDPKPAEDFLKTVKDANEKLAQDIKKVGKDSIEIIKIDTEYQIAKIKTQIASLDLTKNINKETKKGLEEQIRLLNKLAGAQISEIKKKDSGKSDGQTGESSIVPSGVFSQITSTISAIYDGVLTAADAFVNTISTGFNAIFGAGLLNNINAIFTQFANIPDNFIKAFEELPKITEGLADKLKEAIPKILAGLPDFFKIAISAFQEIIPVILGAVPDVIKALASGIVDLADELFNNFIPQLIDALPGVVDAILEKLPDLISTILKSIPKIVSSLVKALPKIVKSLSDALPGIIEVFADNMAPIVESLVDGLIVGSADIIVALVDSFITRGGALRIGIAVARAMLIELPIGIAKGVLSGLKNLGGDTFKKLGADLSSGITLPEIPTPGWLGEINKALNNSGFTKSLQAIVDLLSGISKSIEKTLGQGGGGVVGALKSGDIGGAVTQILGGPGKVLGFAEGGMVPSGFPNDTFPARLTSGELVIDRSTVDKLNRFIDQGGGSSQPIQINLKVGEADLAKVMYKLNKQGYRVA